MQKRLLFEFSVSTNSYSGNNGCNQISGKMDILTNTEIEFGPIMSTKMACENMKIPDRINELIFKVELYELNHLQLFLVDKDKNMPLFYHKTD